MSKAHTAYSAIKGPNMTIRLMGVSFILLYDKVFTFENSLEFSFFAI